MYAKAFLHLNRYPVSTGNGTGKGSLGAEKDSAGGRKTSWLVDLARAGQRDGAENSGKFSPQEI